MADGYTVNQPLTCANTDPLLWTRKFLTIRSFTWLLPDGHDAVNASAAATDQYPQVWSSYPRAVEEA